MVKWVQGMDPTSSAVPPTASRLQPFHHWVSFLAVGSLPLLQEVGAEITFFFCGEGGTK